MIKKIVFSTFIVSAFFCGAMTQETPEAEAAVYQWDIYARNGTDPNPIAWFGDTRATRSKFKLFGATFTFNESTGQFSVAGIAKHVVSGQNWTISGHSTSPVGVRPGGGFPAPGKTIPYDGMIQDMINAGRSPFLRWDDFVMSITTDIIDPKYEGLTEVFGKQNRAGDAAILRWENFVAGSGLMGFQGWYKNSNNEFLGDYHWNFRNPQVIPEPSTVALMGLGLVGLVGTRKFKKKK